MDGAGTLRWLFYPAGGLRNRLVPRWLFLRALGLIYFSAFYSLVFQIKGLIGPYGILRADHYLIEVGRALGPQRFWYAPTLLWFSAGSPALLVLCWAGIVASLLLVLNVWPRVTLAICFVCFLSFVSAAADFSGYQSDGMLLEAGFIAMFLAPAGLRPGWGLNSPPSRASYFLLTWEWFRIYFESGMVKLLSGDEHWRNLTAMDDYYQNGPLPTWIGWYVQHLPHSFHATTVVLTLALELAVVWLAFLPRRWRVICFFIVTPWEAGVILTANYAFLNYLVLALGVLLIDDQLCARFVPRRFRHLLPAAGQSPQRDIGPASDSAERIPRLHWRARLWRAHLWRAHLWRAHLWRGHLGSVRLAAAAILLIWISYATSFLLIRMVWRSFPLPAAPVLALEPFRIANEYGLFAVMTPARYEIEFQGSNDGKTWLPYSFRYKPQALNEAPRIYAPYQPRFDWNLWFASLGEWPQYPIVPRTEECLLANDADVLALFKSNPFPGQPPKMVRAVLWQYWFTSIAEKRKTGMWWRRELLGIYAPTLERLRDGRLAAS